MGNESKPSNEVTSISRIVVWDLDQSQRWQLPFDETGIKQALSIVTQLTRASRKYAIELEGEGNFGDSQEKKPAQLFISGRDLGNLYHGALSANDMRQRGSWSPVTPTEKSAGIKSRNK